MNTTLRLVITGCGGIAGSWLDNLDKRDDVAIVRLVALDPKRAAERAETYSIGASKEWSWLCTPGSGDSDWTCIISKLRMNGFKDLINIEGWYEWRPRIHRSGPRPELPGALLRRHDADLRSGPNRRVAAGLAGPGGLC